MIKNKLIIKKTRMSRSHIKVLKFCPFLSHSAMIVLAVFCVFLQFCLLNCNALQIKGSNANSDKVLTPANPANFVVHVGDDNDQEISELVKSQTSTNGKIPKKSSAEAVRVYLTTHRGKILAKKIKKFVEDPQTQQMVEEQKGYVDELRALKSEIEKTEKAKKFLEFFDNVVESFDGILLGVRRAIRFVFPENFKNSPLIDDPDVEAITFLNLFAILRGTYEDMKHGITYKRFSLVRRFLRRDLELNDEKFEKFRGGQEIIDPNRRDLNNEEKRKNASFLQTTVANSEIPCTINDKSCDLRKESCVSDLPVEDEGSNLDVSWAFASTHALSIQTCFKTGTLVEFSEQEIIDCTHQGCDTGHEYWLWNHLKRTQHLTNDENYPYEEKVGECRREGTPNFWTGNIHADKHFIHYNVFFDQDFVNILKRLITTSGGVFVSINAEKIRHSTTTPVDACISQGTNFYPRHYVVLVGWDTLGDKEHWIYKNSWGDDFGDNGYGYIYSTCSQPEAHPIWFAYEYIMDSYNPTPHEKTTKIHERQGFCQRISEKIHISCVAPETIDIIKTFAMNYNEESGCHDDKLSDTKALCQGKSHCTLEMTEAENCSKTQFCYVFKCQ